MSIFNFQGDRRVVALTIEFNLLAISEWLKSGASEKSGREYWDAIEKIEKEKFDVIRDYHIDVLPNGKASDMYFHRAKGIISNQIDGWEANIDGERWYADKVEMLEWYYWRNFLDLRANDKSILLVPLTDFGDLQMYGKIRNLGVVKEYGESELVKVPVRFVPNGDRALEFTHVSRTISHRQGVGYENALASVYAQSSGLMGREVEY